MRPDQRGSRSFLSAVLLTLTGGYLDAYTYFVRGGVFANAQTGNVIKLGISIAERNLEHCIYYLLPILAFMAGVYLSLFLEETFEKHGHKYMRRSVLAAEICMMVIISFLPQTEVFNIISNILVSLLCAMQMQTFQVFKNQGIATTVATGNLRKAMEYLYHAVKEKDKEKWKASGEFFLINGLFIAGVIAGSFISEYLGIKSILVPAGLLVSAFIHITIVFEKYKHANIK